MEVVHDLGKRFLCLVLTGHILKMDALCGLDVDLRAGFSGAAEHQGVLAAGAFYQLLSHVLADGNEDHQWQNGRQHEAQHGRHRLLDLLCERRAGIIQALRQRRIVHRAGRVDLLLVLVGKEDLVVLDLDFSDVLFLDHAHERPVVHLSHLIFHQQWGHDQIKQQHDQQDDAVVVDQRFFRGFYFLHFEASLSFVFSRFLRCFLAAHLQVDRRQRGEQRMPHGLSGKIDGIFAVQARRFRLICDAVVPFLMQIPRKLVVQDMPDLLVIVELRSRQRGNRGRTAVCNALLQQRFGPPAFRFKLPDRPPDLVMAFILSHAKTAEDPAVLTFYLMELSCKYPIVFTQDP